MEIYIPGKLSKTASVVLKTSLKRHENETHSVMLN